MAKITDGHTLSLSIEVPHFRARKANFALPVPVIASFIRSHNQGEIYDDAFPVVDVVAKVAS